MNIFIYYSSQFNKQILYTMSYFSKVLTNLFPVKSHNPFNPFNILNAVINGSFRIPTNRPDHKKSNETFAIQWNKAFIGCLNELGRTSNSKLQNISYYSQRELYYTGKSGFSTSKTNGEENPKQRQINEIRQKLEKQIRQALENAIKSKIKQVPKQKLSQEDKLKLEQVMQLKLFESQFNLRFKDQIKQKVEKNFTQNMEEQQKQTVEEQIKQNIIKMLTEKVELEVQKEVEDKQNRNKMQQDLLKILKIERQKDKEENKEKEKEKEKVKRFSYQWWMRVFKMLGSIGGGFYFISQLSYFNDPDSIFSALARFRMKFLNQSQLRGYTTDEKFAMIKNWYSLDFKSELKDFIKDGVSEDIYNIINNSYVLEKIMTIYGRDGIGKTSGLLSFVDEQMKKTQDRIPVFYICLRGSNKDNLKSSQKDKSQKFIVSVDQILNLKEGLNIINLLLNIEKCSYKKFMQFLKEQKFSIDYDSNKKRLILIIDQINSLKPCLKQTHSRFLEGGQLLKNLYGLNTSLFQIVVVSSDKQFAEDELVSYPTMRKDKFQFFQIKLSKENFRKYLELRVSSFKLDKDQKTLALITNYYNNKRDSQNILRIYKQIEKNQGQQRAREEIKKIIQKQLINEKNQLKSYIKKNTELQKDLIQMCLQKENSTFQHYDFLVNKNIAYNFYFKKLMTQRAFELYYDEQRKKNGERKQKWVQTQCKNTEGYTMDFSQKVYLVN